MHHTCIRGLAVISTLVLAIGCTPTQPRVYSSNTEFAFVRATPTLLQFRISNQSGSVVRFRGSRGDALGADPWDFSMECKATESVDWDVEPSVITDGYSKNFEVAPGHDLLIRVSSSYANHYKKGRCRLTLWLFDRLELNSNEFEP